MRKLKQYQWMGLLYISPWLIGLLVFQLYPFFASLYYSFTDYNVLKAPTFTGMKNYEAILTKDKDFWLSLKATFLYVLTSLPLKLAFALFIAVLLNMNLRAIRLYRTAYYLPSILGGSVSVAILWRFVFAEKGIVNQFLNDIGISSLNWLGNENLSIWTISLLAVWQFGSSMVLFLAGLKQIPKDLYEAAKVDGARPLRTFFSITLPLLTPITLFNIIMQSINAFQEFSAPYLITNGGPLKSTYLYGMMLYEYAFKFFRMGYASALSWILFVIILLCTLVIFGTSKRWVYYQDER